MWFFIALLSPIADTVVNFVDKYLLEKYFKRDTSSLLIFSTLVNGIIMLPLIYFIIKPQILGVGVTNISIAILNGIIFSVSLLPYFLALKKYDTSSVIPLLQLVPVFGFILAFFFLGEVLSLLQAIAALVVISGSVLILIDTRSGSKFNTKAFLLMIATALLLAINDFLFKFVALDISFWTTAFWNYVGFLILGLVLISFRKYRSNFIEIFTEHKTKVISINLFNELMSMISMLTLAYASLLAPLAIVQTIGGTQPFFVLITGVVLTIFFPKIFKEDMERATIIRKILAILLIFIGSFYLVT